MSHNNAKTTPFDELIAQAKATLAENERTYSRFKQTRQAHWEGLIGHGVDELLQNRALAMKYLDRREPKCRIAALEILANHWTPDEPFSAKCEEMAFHDADSQVRAVALSTLAGYYHASNNARVGHIFADLVGDPSTSANLRIAAYRGLFRIAGIPVEAWPDSTHFRFPDDVDWQFVNTFLGHR